ncbi:hypothetical protein, partial [Streptomyces sp. NPDC058826]|uniref:hypothetical protein n=1 Tax=Streptomyces sp. NPDC058826 TaxID=3346642 RepID=UPI0036D18433
PGLPPRGAGGAAAPPAALPFGAAGWSPPREFVTQWTAVTPVVAVVLLVSTWGRGVGEPFAGP